MRKNWCHVVFVVDPTTPTLRDLVTTTEVLWANDIPIRIGESLGRVMMSYDIAGIYLGCDMLILGPVDTISYKQNKNIDNIMSSTSSAARKEKLCGLLRYANFELCPARKFGLFNTDSNHF